MKHFVSGRAAEREEREAVITTVTTPMMGTIRRIYTTVESRTTDTTVEDRDVHYTTVDLT